MGKIRYKVKTRPTRIVWSSELFIGTNALLVYANEFGTS
jgi:hypothetical protein